MLIGEFLQLVVGGSAILKNPANGDHRIGLIHLMRIFDCTVYDGEIEALLSRLRELYDIVDAFIIVEEVQTSSGIRQALKLRAQWARVQAFALKIRYVVLTEEIVCGTASDRLARRQNAVQRGLLDANEDDLICLSNVSYISNAAIIRQIKGGMGETAESTFVDEGHSMHIHAVASDGVTLSAPYIFFKRELLKCNLDELWCKMKSPLMESEVLPTNKGGDVARFNIWHNEEDASILAAGTSGATITNTTSASDPLSQEQQPIIICPYVFDEDRALVIKVFGLDQPWGQHLPFFLWKDENLIGPEHAFEYCWKQFPDRDVIIVHSDMRPMPNDHTNDWYRALCDHAAQLPQAGIIGCDLLFPVQSPSCHWYAQCAGGYFRNGQIGHYGGGINVPDCTITPAAYEYDERFSNVRPAHWATFGGVYIRREVIDMVGDFDRRYLWAYVMDVDYCTEARIRGQEIYQVPVNLLHEESKTSRKFLELPEYATRVKDNYSKFLQKWDWYLKSLA